MPVLLDEALAKRAGELTDVKIRGNLMFGPVQCAECDPEQRHFTYHSWHCSAYERKLVDRGLCYFIPMVWGPAADSGIRASLLGAIMGSFVKFENVSKIYDTEGVQVNALHDVTFEIGSGEICVVVGQSGAGKTTLLNILGGMDTLTSGKVFLGSEEISAYDRRRLTKYRREDIGFVFQFYNLIPNLTALENVEIATQLAKDPLSPAKVLEDMSTACEAVAARHMGVRVCGVSCLTNPGAGISRTKLTHEEVQEAGRAIGDKFTALVRASIPELDKA